MEEINCVMICCCCVSELVIVKCVDSHPGRVINLFVMSTIHFVDPGSDILKQLSINCHSQKADEIFVKDLDYVKPYVLVKHYMYCNCRLSTYIPKLFAKIKLISYMDNVLI